MNRLPFLFAGMFAMLVIVTACSDDDPAQPAQPVTHDGQSAALGEGQVTSYERVAPDGSLLAVGVRFNETVLSTLPVDMKMLMLNLPKKSGTSPFDHVGFDWNPQGHEPMPLYGKPHFDVHFYVVDHNALTAVQPGPDMIMPEPQFMPPHYISGVEAVPNMGTHYVDTTSAEFTGTPFTKTFIYGFYRGELFFFEPMITKEYLETRPNVTADIRQPAAFKKTGKQYPRKYTVSYDAARKEYSVELTDMKLH
ncbi:MAG: DUF5602 domain-containing protein [Bacteroidia bacterium]|nr:DUF5602 domain-containing protein [Bacteroidia bacterium]